MLGVRLPEEIQKRLDILSAQTKRSKSFYVREAIERYLEDMEDYYMADQAYKEHVESDDDTKTLEALAMELDIDLSKD